MIRAASEEFGVAGIATANLFITDAAGGLTVAAGAVTAQVGHGWKICFQKTYREFWIEPDGNGSFSRDMTPDIVAMLETATGAANRLIILDAKYRIEEGLTAALNSIHTYRDALVHEAAAGTVEGIVTAAYLLTPYVPEIGADYKRTSLPGRLFHPEYRASFQFGAVTMRPGMTMGQLSAALHAIITDATR